MYPIISLGDSSYNTYHIFFIFSIIICVSIFLNLDKNKIQIIDKIYLTSICFISGILGSKLFFFFEDIYMPFDKLISLKNGFVFYGGFIGVVIGLFFFFIKKINSFYESLDRVAISSALGMFFGKIGCFLSGCCFGYPSSKLLNTFNRNPSSFIHRSDVSLFPIQLVDSIINLILFFILFRVYKQNKSNNGEVFLFYIILYSISRFISEFFRADTSRGYFLDLISMSQFYSIILLIISSIILFRFNAKTKTYR